MICVQIGAGEMWTTEHSIDTNVAVDAIWRAWAEVARWPEWNGDIERIEALGEQRVRVVYRLEASGPAAEAIGPAISADFDDTLKALVEHAGR